MFDVVCRGSCASATAYGLINRKASMTTFPFTDWIGSTTTATERGSKVSKDYEGTKRLGSHICTCKRGIPVGY